MRFHSWAAAGVRSLGAAGSLFVAAALRLISASVDRNPLCPKLILS
jgi:hypothetical protein